MGRDKKSRSRSRDRKPVRRRPPSPEKEESSSGEAPAWASDNEEDSTPEAAKMALLEVENAALKAENRELKKKLIEALTKKPAAAASGRSSKRPASKEEREPAREPERRKKEESPPAPRRRPNREEGVKEKEESPPAARRRPNREEGVDGTSKAASTKTDGSPPRRRPNREEGVTGDEAKEKKSRKGEEPEKAEPEGKNAVMLANDMMEAYNESITNNVPPEKRIPLVQAKMGRFMSHFDDKIQILDLKSGGAIIKDRKTFEKRYGCVFRESGAKLKGITKKRFYYDALHRATYVLDFETHESLVTATPGTPPDGKLGVREPRTEHLIVLYEEKGGKLTRMWLKPDTEKLGADPFAAEEVLLKTEVVKQFEAKIVELRDGPAEPRIFQNYHNIPTVG